MNRIIYTVLLALVFSACSSPSVEEINIGVIVPLTERATDLGIAPSNAMVMAVEDYNNSRNPEEPIINLFIKDDQWNKDNAMPLYQSLRKENKIDILFISNTDGTIALQQQVTEDQVLMVNPLNSDSLLSSLDGNIFRIAKQTEEANGLIGLRIVELGLKNILIIQYPNNFMTTASNSVQKILNQASIKNVNYISEKDQTDFEEVLMKAKSDGVDGVVFFGYKEFGFAMKLARDIGIEAKYFGSTVLLDPAYYINSQGAIEGTEFCSFTEVDGNYVTSTDFLTSYKDRWNTTPNSIWPPMQAFDAMNIVINEVRMVNVNYNHKEPFDSWLSNKLKRVRKYPGICGNISITEDGSSRGIYFSLYEYYSELIIQKIERDQF